MKTIEIEEVDFRNTPSIELLEYISWKEEFPKEAEKAFTEFCLRFERSIIRKAEIYANKFNYSATVALELANCTFARVWKYPTFKLEQARVKNVNKAIIKWMIRILWTQLVMLKDNDTCAQPDEEEDLSLINDIDGLLEHKGIINVEAKRDLRIRFEVIESALSRLTPKHKIIYLTYKAYERQGKNIPRKLSAKLREQLQLTQNSIRVYKKEAVEQVKSYINDLNGNR
ncbi:RNA polymerase subunit sigma [Tenacibaculum sp. IMCC1]|nr:hypothetical protein KUL118_15610 [Tenacibaculum sp. KUL118]